MSINDEIDDNATGEAKNSIVGTKENSIDGTEITTGGTANAAVVANASANETVNARDGERKTAEKRTSAAKNDGDEYRFSRIMYVIEAALEYFVSIAVGTVYLAKVAEYLGFSTALTGVLTAFVSLGCGFQLIAIFLASRRPVKRWVTALHAVSQGLFALVYFVPLFNLSAAAKTVIFVATLLVAQVIHNAVNSPKINWYMSLVDDDKRGGFTATKEIISLISGTAFSFLLSFVIDYFEGRGEIEIAFVLSGVGLVVLAVLHTVTLLLSKEKSESKKAVERKSGSIRALFKNKTLFKVILVSVLWNVANYATTSFAGAYQTDSVNGLGFSTSFCSLIIAVGSLVRALVSKPMGRFADKTSFVKMLYLCFAFSAAAFLTFAFTTPANGKIAYFVYYVTYCVGQAGINSATINLVYDYVDREQRTSALALTQTFAGFAGFLTATALGPLVGAIQNNGNSIFGLRVYAQQATAVISLVVVLALVAYLKFVVSKIPRATENFEPLCK